MNEKIKQLAEQAGQEAVKSVPFFRTGRCEIPSWENKVNQIRDEKFAELIVGECLDHIDTMERIAHASNASIPDDYDEYTYLQTLNVLKSLIKSQFGVEE